MFAAGIEGSDRSLLLVYNGDVHCADVSRQPLTGVLEQINSRRRSYMMSEGFEFPPRTDVQLSVGEGPATYRTLMMWASILPLASILLIVRFWPKWRRQVRQSEDLTATLTARYTPKAF